METAALKYYVFGYVVACILATLVIAIERRHITLISANYRQFLFSKWKLATFALASGGIIGIAPFTGDPTWDYIDAALMSLLTFATAPWVTGTIYLAIKRRARATHFYVALCCWLLSASWSYDLYLLLRDGQYPITWLPNLFASSTLYFSAGVLWNLEWRRQRGVFLAFADENWPQPAAVSEGGFFHIVGYALPFMIIASASIAYFLW